jgi:hypothetical protein
MIPTRIVLTVFALSLALPVRAQRSGNCTECPLPGGKRGLDTTMVVHLRNGALLANCCSMSRTMTEAYDGRQQGIRLSFCDRSGGCTDTTVAVTDIAFVRRGGLGGSEAPMRITVRPVREYHRVLRRTLPLSFFELTGFGGYGGSDESARRIGFDNTYFGVEALVAPFGSLLGNQLALAIGGEWLSEAGRARFPVFGHLRWTFLGSSRIVSNDRYLPNPCTFDYASTAIAPSPKGTGVDEHSVQPPLDSSAVLVRERDLHSPAFRPFLFVEAGPIFNGTFDGSTGPDPINPEDKGQYFAGVGAGTPLFNVLTVSIAYRYLRLNLYTPCVACETRSVINTNDIHSVLLKLGWHLGW